MRRSWGIVLGVVGLAGPAARVMAAGYAASVGPDAHVFSFSGGESQSAVVPPGKKSQCPKGRVLVSDDWAPPPLNATQAADTTRRPTVRWHNLGVGANVLGQSGSAKFIPPPQVSSGTGLQSVLHDRRWIIPGADHQLVALPNGNLVYQTLAATRERLSPEPAWFDFTSRNLRKEPKADGSMPEFGPGARSTLATWTSTDCGETFAYTTEIDSFGPGYEECANPQPKAACAACTKPPLPFDMGGTDGPNLIVDRSSGRLYALFLCAGRQVTVDASGAPVLGNKVDRTYIFSSDDGGKSFVRRGSYSPRLWGPQAVALAKDRLALGVGTHTVLTQPNAVTGALDFLPPSPAVAGDKVAWQFPSGTDLARRMRLNKGGNTLVARAPGGGELLIFGFPARVEKTEGNPSTETQGFRLFLHDPAVQDGDAGEAFRELPAILPSGSPANSAVLHVTALVAEEAGPVLVYWTDLDGSTNTARVRGRLLDENSFEPGKPFTDFDIALAGGVMAPFTLTEPGVDAMGNDLRAYFYGDYRTAGAFRDPKVTETPFLTLSSYRFYPVWVQPWTEELSGNAPGGSVRVAEVTVTKTVIKRGSFQRELLHKEPELFVVQECCDFGPLFERDVAGRSREARALHSSLLRADPRLGEPRLRVGRQPSRALGRVRTIPAPPDIPRALRETFDRGEEPREPDSR
jgi:hypothetical protein